MAPRFPCFIGRLNDLEQRIDKAARERAPLPDPDLIHTVFVTSAGLEILISAYAKGDRPYRTRIEHCLTDALTSHIDKANGAIAILNEIFEDSTKAKFAAREAANRISAAMPFVAIMWGSRAQKLIHSCSSLAANEEERLDRVKRTRSVIAEMRDRWISTLQHVLNG